MHVDVDTKTNSCWCQISQSKSSVAVNSKASHNFTKGKGHQQVHTTATSRKQIVISMQKVISLAFHAAVTVVVRQISRSRLKHSWYAQMLVMLLVISSRMRKLHDADGQTTNFGTRLEILTIATYEHPSCV